MSLKPGDAVPAECTAVDNLPLRQLADANGALAEVAGSGVTAAGKLLLASRKQDYISAFAAQGLTICDDSNHPFAAASKVLSLRLQQSGLQVYWCGRDFVNVDFSNDPVALVYWPGILSKAIEFGYHGARKHFVVVGDIGLLFDGHDYTNMATLYGRATRPADMSYYALSDSYSFLVDGTVSDYFNGNLAVRPETTAVLCFPSAFATYQVGDIPYTWQTDFVANLRTWTQDPAAGTTGACVLRMLKDRAALVAFSQNFSSTYGPGDRSEGAWNVGAISVPSLFPMRYDSPTQDSNPVLRPQGPSDIYGPFTATAAGSALLGALVNSIGGSDSSNSRFELVDAATLGAWGMRNLATDSTGYCIDLGGVLTARYFADRSAALGFTI